ncbi:hypothetical protein [Kiloniella majae]|uniref:hypothetical protein n=1 Tax=Kiloniella majae TaxID=1938558 RepID=UPI000A277BB3|nr:hypothetical protein [Kiloniella majae]
MKISNKRDAGFFSGVSPDGITKKQPSEIKKETAPARLTVQKALKPFTGDLRSFGITERLKELFEAAKIAAESGRILPRGSFLNITV